MDYGVTRSPPPSPRHHHAWRADGAVAAHPLSRHLGRRAPVYHQEHRQGHRLARRARQTEQGRLSSGTSRPVAPLTPPQGLRSRLETTTNAAGDDELKKVIAVSLRPGDPFAKRLLSTPVRTNNLLFKVTVPKRTGRRRRRGSSGPFLTEEEIAQGRGHDAAMGPIARHSVHVDASTIFRSLRDNASTYKVSLAGIVDETHRFRST